MTATPDMDADGSALRAVGQLNEREGEVIEVLSRVGDQHAAARRLGMEYNTLRTHVASIHRKLGVHTTIEAVIQALRTESRTSAGD